MKKIYEKRVPFYETRAENKSSKKHADGGTAGEDSE